MGKNQSKSVIDFSNYIAEQTINFTGREWVFQAINEWLADPDGSRFFLLKGEPGSGKTAISARLSQFAEGTAAPPDGLAYLHPNFLSAFHFCSARDSRWINPRIFVESLAMQLAKHYPAYAQALAEKSGDRSIRIEVQQQMEQGNAVGVFINRLDVSNATPEDAFNRVVREPLEKLLSEGFDSQVLILVDALDEALSSTIIPTIVSLLSQTDNLPSHVRFILTTRQESRVENEFRRVKELSLSIPNDQNNQDDICRYVKGRLLVDLELVDKIDQLEFSQVEDLVEEISSKSVGNFLYARFMLDAMAKGLRSLTKLDGLPTGLDELYFDSFNRVAKLGKRDWFNEYRPLMGVLSVAQESLTLAQLQALTAQPELSLWQHLSDLQQFIQEAKTLDGKVVQETRYRLYHQSVIDFLGLQRISIEQRQLLNNYYISLDEWHRKVADRCKLNNIMYVWEDEKHDLVEQRRREYARKYYITHLYLAQAWQRLFEVLDTVQYGKAKLRNDPSTHSFALDLDLGRQATMWEEWTVDEGIALLPRLWQYTLLRCSLTSRADRYPEEAFRLLALLGRKQEALGLAELLTDPAKRVRIFLRIAEQLPEQAKEESEWLELLMRVGDIARTIHLSREQAEALRDLAMALTQLQQWEQAKRVIGTIEDPQEQAGALSALGTALAQAQQWEQASQVWEQAERVIGTIEDPQEQAGALRDLAMALAQAQQWEQAKRVIGTIEDPQEQAEVLKDLAMALTQLQQWEQASQVWEQAEHAIDTIRDSEEQAKALSALSTALAQAQKWEQAERVLSIITYSSWQAKALSALGTALAQAQQWKQASQVWEQAERIVGSIMYSDEQVGALQALAMALAQAQQRERAERVLSAITYSEEQAMALKDLAIALAQAQQWEQAERVIGTIEDLEERDMALRVLSTDRAMALAQAQQWEQAEHVIGIIQNSYLQAEALNYLGLALANEGKFEQLLHVIQRVWRQVETREKALSLFSIASTFISRKPQVGIAFFNAFTWVDRFLGE